MPEQLTVLQDTGNGTQTEEWVGNEPCVAIQGGSRYTIHFAGFYTSFREGDRRGEVVWMNNGVLRNLRAAYLRDSTDGIAQAETGHAARMRKGNQCNIFARDMTGMTLVRRRVGWRAIGDVIQFSDAETCSRVGVTGNQSSADMEGNPLWHFLDGADHGNVRSRDAPQIWTSSPQSQVG
ncbi:hypothetical protein K504DRAFT_527567 [Pleomassaria siparia CBS 279.74]|uniref:Uncharacterized protein n=1 Tax=Pleomassaria siparia CBS 279.74 TaxID=1314801 RepID=A0A6G1K5T7_9PLEO|nr:hypothetical protein K504DRAFT_527567 [Pleomassaria siparia CBS 279.74]